MNKILKLSAGLLSTAVLVGAGGAVNANIIDTDAQCSANVCSDVRISTCTPAGQILSQTKDCGSDSGCAELEELAKQCGSNADLLKILIERGNCCPTDLECLIEQGACSAEDVCSAIESCESGSVDLNSVLNNCDSCQSDSIDIDMIKSLLESVDKCSSDSDCKSGCEQITEHLPEIEEEVNRNTQSCENKENCASEKAEAADSDSQTCENGSCSPKDTANAPEQTAADPSKNSPSDCTTSQCGNENSAEDENCQPETAKTEDKTPQPNGETSQCEQNSCGEDKNYQPENETEKSAQDTKKTDSGTSFLTQDTITAILEKYGISFGGDSNPTNYETHDPDAQSAAETDHSAGVSDYEQRVAELVNKERVRYGLEPLSVNVELSNVARLKSQDMKDKKYFSHNSPTYGSPFDMMKKFGISYKTAGENIAMGQRTPEEAVDAWMNSEGHRANILNGSFKEIGVGYVSEGNYWTQMFIG